MASPPPEMPACRPSTVLRPPPAIQMPTKTQTTTTHYHIQKKRRKEFIEEWRNYRQSVIRKDDVKLEIRNDALELSGMPSWHGQVWSTFQADRAWLFA